MLDRPTEIQLQNDRGADLGRLVAVATMGHKYTLPSFEKWALGIIWIHCQPGRDYLDDCSQDMLCRIFEAAEKGGRQDLCSLVEKRWLLRLKNRQLPLRHALDFGEMHGRRAFLGNAYYQQVVDMKSFLPNTDESLAADFSQSDLTHEQLHRLLSGYCSIALAWQKIRKTTIPLTPRCHKSYHEDSFVKKILRDDSDPDRGLDMLKELEAANDRFKYNDCKCGQPLLKTLVSTFSLSIPDHFLGQAARQAEEHGPGST